MVEIYFTTFKVVVFGDAGAGKKEFIQKFLNRSYISRKEKREVRMSIGVDFVVKSMDIDGKKVKLQIWDFGGEERFRFLLPTYVKGADGAFFMYDVTNYSSLAHIDDWLLIIRREMKLEQHAFPIILVGNKAHLVDDREVTGKDGINVAKSRGLQGFVECSTETGENVEEAFVGLTKLMLDQKMLEFKVDGKDLQDENTEPEKEQLKAKTKEIELIYEVYDHLFKTILLGDSGVGKTELAIRFSKGFFTEDYSNTIGLDFHVQSIIVNTKEGPVRVKLQIWDSRPQERFSSIRPMYYRGSEGALLIFDLTNSSSFEILPHWIEEMQSNVKTDIPILLVGNKNDLKDERVVDRLEAQDFAKSLNCEYIETSAMTNENVDLIFERIAINMIEGSAAYRLSEYIGNRKKKRKEEKRKEE